MKDTICTFVTFSLEKLATLVLLITIFYHFIFPQYAFALSPSEPFMIFPYDRKLQEEYRVLQGKKRQEAERKARIEGLKRDAIKRYHIITGYSSTHWQTDNTPFITASGMGVREGIVAANTLPFGAKILIPDIFGDKVFTVQDRMAPKNYHKIDIWFPSTGKAKQFGIKRAKILVLPPEAAALLENPEA